MGFLGRSFNSNGRCDESVLWFIILFLLLIILFSIILSKLQNVSQQLQQLTKRLEELKNDENSFALG